MTTDLGMPGLPAQPVAERRKSRQVVVGKGKHAVPVGGGAPVSVQSMTTTLTADVNATLQQIAELTATGCQIVRVAVPSQDDADALPEIARKSQIPVIADIHFQPRYVFAAIDAGCAAVRVNPGNIKAFDDKVAEIARAASAAGRADKDRRQRGLAGQAPAGQVRACHCRGAGGVRPVGVLAVRGAWIHRYQDLGQAPRSRGDDQRLPSARAGVRLPAAPGRDRGGARLPGHGQVGRGVRCPARGGDRGHDPGVAVGSSGGGGEGRHRDPGVARPSRARPRNSVLPVVWPGPGGRVHARRPGDRRAGGHGGAASRRGHGLRRQRPRRGQGG